MRGASAMSCGMGVSLPPSILNLKTRGMPFGMPTRLISSSDRLSMYFTTPEVEDDRTQQDGTGQGESGKLRTGKDSSQVVQVGRKR